MRWPLVMSLLVSAIPLVACGEVKSDDDDIDAPPGGLTCGEASGELACHTFEGEDPAWMPLTAGGVAVIDASDAAGGESSLRATVAAGGTKAVRSRSVSAADRYYSRFWAKVPTGSNTSGLSILRLGEPVEPFLGVNVEIAGGMLGAAVQTGNVYVYPTPMPIGQWVCLEFELLVNDTGGRVVVRMDGTTVVDRDALDTRPAGGVGDVEIGLSYVDPTATSESVVLVDDLVVARDPLPSCPAR
jgi:hypothetical protein